MSCWTRSEAAPHTAPPPFCADLISRFKVTGVTVVAGGGVLLGDGAAKAECIAGTVKDTTGAVMPGVTVEASSPALIEKTRSAVTDGTGQYRIVSLSAGVYTVTFTLSGFST